METQNTIENAQSDCDFSVGALDIIAGIADVAAIIDKQTFEQAQLLLENHKQGNVRVSANRKIHRYGKEYCTPHRIYETQLDEVIYDEVRLLLIRIQEQSKKYDKIMRDWQRQKPAYERKIEQYKERIASLRQWNEDLIIERNSYR